MTHEQREQAAEVLEKFQNGIYGHGGKVGLAIDIAIAALREPEWVRTVDRLPTEADAGVDEKILTIYDDGETRVMGTDYWAYVAMVPEMFPYWLPVPKLPEVEG